MDDKKLVKVRKELLEPHLTCPYCENLLKNATSNTECAHTFCRRCIEAIVTKNDITQCPVCQVDWGTNPLQKMRPDHTLQSLRDKLFPKGNKTVEATEVVSTQSNASIEHPEEMMSLISLGTTYKSSSTSEDNSQGVEPKEEVLASLRTSSSSTKKGKKKKTKPRVPGQKKELTRGESSQSSQEQQAATGTKTMPLGNASSVWLTLEPSENKHGVTLPEIDVPYIRMNGRVPVSLVHKYVQKKLGLESEEEIEITCLGELVPPGTELQDLYMAWLDSVFPEEEITVTVGSSAERFVMHLNYGLKVLNP